MLFLKSLVVVQPLQEVRCAAAAYHNILVSLWVELKLETCAEVLRYVLYRIYRDYAAARYAEKELRIEHLLYRIQ